MVARILRVGEGARAGSAYADKATIFEELSLRNFAAIFRLDSCHGERACHDAAIGQPAALRATTICGPNSGVRGILSGAPESGSWSVQADVFGLTDALPDDAPLGHRFDDRGRARSPIL
ncbi:MAG: hypothetical protein DWQ31_05410 [Planctomycetota bacterium]|nr:MAG: hypothetical protein DWQ31_05410 [Planctomycetota bacterium]REJ91077.1 MAG: hypothetical protein DWQ35_15280 [Planctomycetota bacterium]